MRRIPWLRVFEIGSFVALVAIFVWFDTNSTRRWDRSAPAAGPSRAPISEAHDEETEDDDGFCDNPHCVDCEAQGRADVRADAPRPRDPWRYRA